MVLGVVRLSSFQDVGDSLLFTSKISAPPPCVELCLHSLLLERIYASKELQHNYILSYHHKNQPCHQVKKKKHLRFLLGRSSQSRMLVLEIQHPTRLWYTLTSQIKVHVVPISYRSEFMPWHQTLTSKTRNLPMSNIASLKKTIFWTLFLCFHHLYYVQCMMLEQV